MSAYNVDVRTNRLLGRRGRQQQLLAAKDEQRSSYKEVTFVNENAFQPSPIDTTTIRLPEELLMLTEKLAQNAHDVWARGRISQGWTYGSVRDDALKQTPCLVPYSELSEGEKAYDRNTALETIKLIVKMGYQIVKV